MSTHKFKKGDRVRLTEEGAKFASDARRDATFEAGRFGTVVEEGVPYPRVDLDNYDGLGVVLDPAKEFTHAPEPTLATYTDGTTPQQGDRVALTAKGARKWEREEGALGTVEGRHGPQYFNVVPDDGGSHLYVRPDEVRPVTVAPGDYIVVHEAAKRYRAYGGPLGEPVKVVEVTSHSILTDAEVRPYIDNQPTNFRRATATEVAEVTEVETVLAPGYLVRPDGERVEEGDVYDWMGHHYSVVTDPVPDDLGRVGIRVLDTGYETRTDGAVRPGATHLGRPGVQAKPGDRVLIVEQSTSMFGSGAEVGEVVTVEEVDDGLAVIGGRSYRTDRYVIVERATEPEPPTWPNGKLVEAGDVYRLEDGRYSIVVDPTYDEDGGIRSRRIANGQEYSASAHNNPTVTYVGRTGVQAKPGDRVLIVMEPRHGLGPEVGSVVTVEEVSGFGTVRVDGFRWYASSRYVIVERAPDPDPVEEAVYAALLHASTEHTRVPSPAAVRAHAANVARAVRGDQS